MQQSKSKSNERNKWTYKEWMKRKWNKLRINEEMNAYPLLFDQTMSLNNSSCTFGNEKEVWWTILFFDRAFRSFETIWISVEETIEDLKSSEFALFSNSCSLSSWFLTKTENLNFLSQNWQEKGFSSILFKRKLIFRIV